VRAVLDMRTPDEIAADAEARSPFSNHTEYEMWAGHGRGCYDCANDDDATEKYCPILGAALLGGWPKEWTRRTVQWEIGGKSGSYEVVDECTDFDRRPDDDGPDDGDDQPEPDPGPPPVLEGQIDMFEVFADRIAEQAAVHGLVSA